MLDDHAAGCRVRVGDGVGAGFAQLAGEVQDASRGAQMGIGALFGGALGLHPHRRIRRIGEQAALVGMDFGQQSLSGKRSSLNDIKAAGIEREAAGVGEPDGPDRRGLALIPQRHLFGLYVGLHDGHQGRLVLQYGDVLPDLVLEHIAQGLARGLSLDGLLESVAAEGRGRGRGVHLEHPVVILFFPVPRFFCKGPAADPVSASDLVLFGHSGRRSGGHRRGLRLIQGSLVGLRSQQRAPGQLHHRAAHVVRLRDRLDE